MSSSGKIQVPAEEYVIYFPPTDQSDYRITLNCSIIYSYCFLGEEYSMCIKSMGILQEMLAIITPLRVI